MVDRDHGADISVDADEFEGFGEYGKKDESQDGNDICFWKDGAKYAEVNENTVEMVGKRADGSEGETFNEGMNGVDDEGFHGWVMKGDEAQMVMGAQV